MCLVVLVSVHPISEKKKKLFDIIILTLYENKYIDINSSTTLVMLKQNCKYYYIDIYVTFYLFFLPPRNRRLKQTKKVKNVEKILLTFQYHFGRKHTQD